MEKNLCKREYLRSRRRTSRLKKNSRFVVFPSRRLFDEKRLSPPVTIERKIHFEKKKEYNVYT